jgi:hypothetical protein
VKNGQELVTKSIQVVYRVHVSGTSVLVPSDVDEEMVRNAPSATGATFDQRIPKVGETNYESPDGKIYPWWRCTSVSVTRNNSNGYEFAVSATFVDDTGNEDGMLPPTGIEQIDPVINYSFQEYEVTAWTEDDTSKGTSAHPDACVLPTGTLYSNPPVKVTGQEIVTFSQYEQGFDVGAILGDGTNPGRLYSVNKDNFYIDTNLGPQYPNSVVARHAMITDIAFENASVRLSSGYVACQRVTYTIGIRRYKLMSLQDDGSFLEISPGWDQPRVRADTRCKSSTGDIGPAANIESWGNQQVYLKGDGADAGKPHPTVRQYGIPPYDLLKLQPEIFFDYNNGGFLR